MKALVLLAGAVGAIGYGTIYDHDPPPPRFQADASATIRFASEAEVDRECSIGIPPPPPGRRYMACNLPDGTMLLANPCHYLAQDYALTLCHELGHHNGWPKDHPL